MSLFSRSLPLPSPFLRSRLRIARLLPLALLPVALAACLSTPIPDQTPPLPPQWRNAPAADAAPAAAPDPRGWWHAFGDPRLDALVEQALAANLDTARRARACARRGCCSNTPATRSSRKCARAPATRSIPTPAPRSS